MMCGNAEKTNTRMEINGNGVILFNCIIFSLIFQTFFCPDKRSGAKYDLPSSLVVLSESAEAASALLSQQVFSTCPSSKYYFSQLTDKISCNAGHESMAVNQDNIHELIEFLILVT